MSINTGIWELLILRKKNKTKQNKQKKNNNVEPSHFHDVIETANMSFMLERKSFSDLQSSEIFYDLLFD